MQFLNEKGQVVRLTRPLTRAGGEGQVFEIEHLPGMVAKVYHQPPDAQKEAKLRYQVYAAKPEVRNVAAWPTDLLLDCANPKKVCGIIMPLVGGKEIHKLYGPADRQAEFPSVGWDFLIHVAMNCAAAFETLHEQGAVMADVNEGNLLVNERDGRVGLIDCDSYQIHDGNNLFLCDVGIPMWTPPELQGRNFRGLQRTANHDRFGLAVIIFRLLFMGRHPFAGIPTRGEQFAIEEAISKFLFAFSPQCWSRGVKPPPMALQLGFVPERIRQMFERAFLDGSVQPNARPAGREWVQELRALLSATKKGCMDPGHKFWNGLTSCPWCEIVTAGGPNFFISVSLAAGTTNFTADFTAFWATIERVLQGALMREKVGIPLIGRATPRPMPPRPIPPTLIVPVMPEKPVAVPKPILPSPSLPERPAILASKMSTKMPIGSNETVSRICRLGACFFGLVIVFGLQVGINSVAFGASWAFATCIFLAISKSRQARQDRTNRLQTDQAAEHEAQKRAQEEHAQRIAEYEALVDELTKQHALAVARIEAEYQVEWQKQDQEYQKEYNAYLEAMRQYESTQKKYNEDENRWVAEYNARSTNEQATRQHLDRVRENLSNLLSSYQAQVRAQFPTLELAKQRFEKSKVDEISDMRKLHQKRQEVQLQQFLMKELIHNATITNIGPVKKRTLLAYGYGSAWDIRPDMRVPGFGPTFIGALMAWRRFCETQFRYNPNAPLPPGEVRLVKLRHAQTRQSALMEVRSGAAKLEALENQVRAAVSAGKVEILQRARAHAQAKADFEACV